jgi:hypothetical protein
MLVMLLLVAIVAPVFGEDHLNKKKGKRNRQRSMATNVIKRLDAVNLTDEQGVQIKELAKQADQQVKEIRERAGITRELLKARAAAQKELKSTGKKGKELIAAVNEKAGYTEEQKQAFTEETQVRAKLVLAAIGLLSDEQKANLPRQMQRTLERSQKEKKGKKRRQNAA